MRRDRRYQSLVCPHCLAPVERFDHFCPRCAGPITSHASIDPIGQIHATGRAYRQAMEAPRLIVVIGIWLLFSPQLLVMLLELRELVWTLINRPRDLFYTGADYTVLGSGIFAGIVTVAFFGGYTAICIAILWRTTASYYRNRFGAKPSRGFEAIATPIDEPRDDEEPTP